MMSWTVATRADRLISPTRLVVERADHSQIECRTGYCEDVRALWWKDESNILFIAKTGWARSETSVYRWNLDKPRPELVVSTADVLIGCMQVDDEIICAREGAVSPRRIVALNDVNGSERVLFAPNSGLTPERLGSVSRLRFTNDFGVQSYADLVLPPGHRRGEKHPLIVVQYNTDGFLRGGTGDEVPIQVLAGRGFAVLSFSRPDFVEFAMKSTNEVELRRRNRINWTDRRNVQSSLEKAIRLAVETGSVDEDRMGISGFSDGSSTTQWALINSSLFRVASLGACCVDRVAVALNGGPGYATYLREMGHPAFDKPDAQFWAPISLVQNVDKIDVPILVQAGDTEYEMGLDTAEAFRSRGKAFELYVFPDEPHYKWQPAHRLAMYDRVVDWFSFWLLKQMDCSVEKRTRYARWTSMPGSPAMENLSCHDGTG